MQRILVIAPHPDDEAIGCGGSIAMHIAEGDRVDVITLTSGEKGLSGMSEEDVIRIREAEGHDAAAILGLNSLEYWHEPDGGFQASPFNVARLLSNLEHIPTDIIYVPHEKDAHHDHQQAAWMVIKAVEQLKDPAMKPVINMYEVWTPLNTIDIIHDISPYIEVKRSAILAHRCQCEVMKLHEATIALNRYRGEMHNTTGGIYAEVFMRYRYLYKQEVITDHCAKTVLIRYHESSSNLKNITSLYNQLREIPFVPDMQFAKGLIIQEYCGDTLHALYTSNYKFSDADKQTIEEQLTELIWHLFNRKLAHRKLHSGNICWDGEQIWVTNWDSACIHEPSSILEHYDLTCKGLPVPADAARVNIFENNKQFSTINEIISPYKLTIGSFERSESSPA
jgi:LmbE family N-acetylglucosaminyl deacetylase